MRTPWNKGIKMTKATKERISISRKGIKAWNKGKSWPDEVIEKISDSRKGKTAWNKGLKWSKSVKDKIRRTMLSSTITINPYNERVVTSSRVRFAVLKRDGFKCRYCGKSSKDTILEVDHRVPVSKAGKSTMDNLITSCIRCNRGKSNLI